MIRYVGIDLHKHLIVGHVIDAAGKVLDTFRYDRVTPVSLEHIGKNRLTSEDHVVVEATTNCWAVARALEPHVARMVISNPLITKAIAKAKVKTDKVDARVLSHLLRLDYALPRTTETKLRDLRIQATGKTRSHGPTTGSKARANAPKGCRTIKPLAEVYRNEEIPAASPAPAGERRHLAASKLEAFAESLQHAQVVPHGTTPELAADNSR